MEASSQALSTVAARDFDDLDIRLTSFQRSRVLFSTSADAIRKKKCLSKIKEYGNDMFFCIKGFRDGIDC